MPGLMINYVPRCDIDDIVTMEEDDSDKGDVEDGITGD